MTEKFAFIFMFVVMPIISMIADNESTFMEKLEQSIAYVLVLFVFLLSSNFQTFLIANLFSIVLEYCFLKPLYFMHLFFFSLLSIAFIYGAYKTRNLKYGTTERPNPKLFFDRCNETYIKFRADVFSLIK